MGPIISPDKNKKLSRIERTGCWIIQPNVIGEEYIVYIRKLDFYMSNRVGFVDGDKLITIVKEKVLKYSVSNELNDCDLFTKRIFDKYEYRVKT